MLSKMWQLWTKPSADLRVTVVLNEVNHKLITLRWLFNVCWHNWQLVWRTSPRYRTPFTVIRINSRITCVLINHLGSPSPQAGDMLPQLYPPPSPTGVSSRSLVPWWTSSSTRASLPSWTPWRWLVVRAGWYWRWLSIWVNLPNSEFSHFPSSWPVY